MSQPVKILIVEDMETDRLLLINEIKKANIIAEYSIVVNEEEFCSELTSFKPDIILSDYNLPAFNGMDALRLTGEIAPNIPFILVTGSLNEEIAVEIMKLGAFDYILKDNLKRIGPSIEHSLERKKERDEKLQAQKELLESEERYRGLVELATDAILVHSNYEIRFANKAASEMLGTTSAEELIGKNIISFISPEYIPEFQSKIKMLVAGTVQKTEALELKIIRADERTIFVEIFGNTLIFDGIRSVQNIMRDITERKRIEKEILEAKEKAEESDKLKTILLANMSHELRTPMNGILGFAQILKDELTDPEQVLTAKKIYTSGKRLMSTISSVLDLSELEASHVQVKKEEIRIMPFVRMVSKGFSEELESKNLEMQISTTSENLQVVADEILLTQVLKSILDNAIKFTDKGTISISISIVPNDNSSYTLLSIRDQGIGISRENIDLIFEPFRQVSEGTKRSYEGSGLGLTIARKMLQLMDGRLEVESVLNEGSTFNIYLPQANNADTPAVIPERQDNPDVSSGQKPEVLLVEDNYLNKDVTVLFLKNHCRIDHAPTGEAAIEMVKDKHYAAVLMDINLGAGLDGIETMKKIRMIDDYVNAPIAALTGYAMKGDRERLLKEGFDNYLAKPFERYEIIELVKLLLN